MKRGKVIATMLVAGAIALLEWNLPRQHPPQEPPPVAVVEEEKIPAGIIVTESTSAAPPPSVRGNAPGDRLLGDYGNPALPPKQDLVLMAHAISDFLLASKQATDRPLSANEEWSAALRGQRPGTEPWFSSQSPALDSQQRLIDRWQTPLHFHALGGKQWEIRSAGPDRKLWTEDDLLEKVSG